MEFSADIAYNICSLLDNETLKKIYVLGIVPSLSQLVLNSQLWHSRIETLTRLRISFSPSVDWRETYQLLNSLDLPSFYNSEDNVTVLELMLRMGYRPRGHELERAAYYGKPRILSFLLNRTDIDPNSSEGNTSLTLSMIYGHEECFDLLLADQRVDPDESCNAGATTLIIACDSRRMSYDRAAKMLLNDGRAHPGARRNAPLIRAIKNSRLETVKLLIADLRIDLTLDQNLALRSALYRGEFEVARLLLEQPSVLATIDKRTLDLANKASTRYVGGEHVADLILAALESRKMS